MPHFPNRRAPADAVRPVAGLPVPPRALLAGASLFLDFDGTLVPIARRPDAVRVDPGLIDLLAKLQVALDGRLAVVSGRDLATLDALLGGMQLPLAGSHGLELRLPGGTAQAPPRPPALDLASTALHDFVAPWPDLLVEDKRFGVGLHYRGAPAAAGPAGAFARDLAQRLGLRVQQGKMVFELRPAGADKGAALRTLMALPGWSGTQPVSLGDDLTDEGGFAAAAELGGAGVLVGAFRETRAKYRLADVAAARRWLESAVQ